MITPQVLVAKDIRLSVSDQGAGRPLLVLHGGSGPVGVRGFTGPASGVARVVTPTHPGFDGTERPDAIWDVADLADAYVALLDRLDLTGVVIVGFSLGGWIAAETALRARESGRVTGLVLVDAVGIEVPGETIADLFAMMPNGVAEVAYHDPERYRFDPATMTDEQRAVRAGNLAASALYGRERGMRDPSLRARLGALDVPTLVVWGESDGIVTPAYGRAFADAIPSARFEQIAECGHMPQLEQPERLTELVRKGFLG